MGRASTKQGKNVYFQSREEVGMTRAEASEAMQFISESRIEKIESEKLEPQPEDILAMASAYRKPDLCNYYCSQKCPIGQQYVPACSIHGLAQIVLDTLASLNTLNKEKDRLIEIAADGQITDNEYKDFAMIQEKLERIVVNANALQFWIDGMIASGKVDKKKFESYRHK